MLNIKEIALKVADSLRNKIDGISHMQSNQGLVAFAEALIAEIAKQNEPVARLLHRKTKSLQESCRTVARTYEECKKDAYPDDWEEGKPLYTYPPTAEQIANETAEAIAKMLESGSFLSTESKVALAANGAAKAIRRGAWKGFKK